ncbi:MAG: protein translocase subunit SecF [Patescibacteria group bacterium]|nr:protein translocase subunit SecF [Patescibacteria group bacterium]
MFDLIKYKKIFIGFSLLMLVLALVSIFTFGFKEGIDFSGGALWQIRFTSGTVSVQELQNYLQNNLKIDNAVVTTGSENDVMMIRTNELSENQHQEYLAKMNQDFSSQGPVEELGFQSIGPTIGSELRSKAIWAFILVLLGISLYIAFAFRKVSYPVSSWKYGVATLVCLFHDAVIPAGLYAWFGHLKGLEIDSNFIVAILVIMGFSVHDTIVVFDRIRENLILHKGKSLGDIINISVNQTFARSINTSLTLAIVLSAMFLFGAPTMSYFVLLILVGTIIGTYSSIFMASPLLTYLQNK